MTETEKLTEEIAWWMNTCEYWHEQATAIEALRQGVALEAKLWEALALRLSEAGRPMADELARQGLTMYAMNWEKALNG